MKVKKIILGIVAILGIILIAGAFQSADYTVSRELVMNASAEKLFPHINNPKLMNEWAGWKEMDPQATMTYSGPEEGIGAKCSWEGGKYLGTGSATIIESQSNALVTTQLEYIKPMAMSQVAFVALEPSGDQTKVTWSVSGKKGYINRVMCLFFSMEKHVGGNFEKALATLKAKIESEK